MNCTLNYTVRYGGRTMNYLKFRLTQLLKLKDTELKLIDDERKLIHNGRWRKLSLSIEDTEVALIIVDTEQFFNY